MRDNDSGHFEFRQRAYRQAFEVRIHMTGRLIQEQYSRFVIERPGEQQALPLTSGQGITHVTDTSMKSHVHSGYLVSDADDFAALLCMFEIRFRIEKSNIVQQ